ncbi:MAG: URC4/urg3 family protein [Cyanobacteriota bacterium]|nr:URC4/urg3 family protein [Cyanobacteriota bacterium]
MPEDYPGDPVRYLLSAPAIRDRCLQLFELAGVDHLPHFRVNPSKMQGVADYVVATMRRHYPDLDIPFHSRWRHLEVGGVDRWQHLDQELPPLSALDKARVKFDWVIPSVLLDAGAGAGWSYWDPLTQTRYARSEGLAIASFHLFKTGSFSSRPDFPWQTDGQGLQNLTLEQLAVGLQVSAENPLVGLEGRWHLLQQLGKALTNQPAFFGSAPGRLGYLVDYLWQTGSPISAQAVFDAVMASLGTIWPGRLHWQGVNLGDAWFHSSLSGSQPHHQWVPFHKLSQWLTYSLLEPLQALGASITDLDALTGLPEYRNGGLFLDLGLLTLRDPTHVQQAHWVGSELVVEWRALTVCLLDEVAQVIRQSLGLTSQSLPLVKVLQGGTWLAGRQMAAQRRPGGIPPLQIISDGTVF